MQDKRGIFDDDEPRLNRIVNNYGLIQQMLNEYFCSYSNQDDSANNFDSIFEKMP